MMRFSIRFKKRSLAFVLSATGIDGASEWVVDNLTESGVERRDRVRARLLFEEALLNLAERFGAEKDATVFLEGSHGRLRLRLVVEGERFNPLGSQAQDMQSEWEMSLFSVIGMRMHYSYSSRANVVRISLPQSTLNPVLKIGIAILVGFLIGVIGNVCVPDSVQEAVSGVILQPIADMWVRLLQAISGPIIFLTALTATLGAKHIADFGGSRFSAILRYFIISAIVVVFTMLCSLPFFPLDIAATEASGDIVGTTLNGILKIVPGNLIEPFSTANTPQLLLIAIVTGYLLGTVDSRVNEVKVLIQQLNTIGLSVAQWACNLVPFFVGLLLCLKIWTHDLSLLGAIWLPLVLATGITLAISLAIILITTARFKVRPLLLVRKLKGPFVEALARGTMNYSSVDGLAESCKSLLGINGTFARATLPQGLVLYMPTSAIGICVFVLFAAQTQHLFIDQMWLLSAAALSVVLAVATPPLTGANLLSFIMAFAYLGISSDAMLDVMIFDILFGELCIAFDQAALQIDTIWQAKRLGFLNEDTLRAPLPVLGSKNM